MSPDQARIDDEFVVCLVKSQRTATGSYIKLAGNTLIQQFLNVQ